MKKGDLKKLALMGITGGMLLSQPEAQATPIPGYPTAGCSSSGMNWGETTGYYGDNGYEQNGFTVSSGCGSSQGGFTVSQGCGGMQPMQGCGSYQGGFTVSQGCGSAPMQGCNSGPTRESPQGGFPVSQGCGGAQPVQGGQTSYYNNPNQRGTQGSNRGYQNQPENYDNRGNPQMPQHMMPQGSQNQPKTGYNYSNKNRWYTAENDEMAKPGYGSIGGQSSTQTMMTEDELMSKLNDQGKAMFRSLSPEGKALALKLAGQSCKGHNDCKGLNSCKSDKNACAGQGGCKGQSQCSFKDKNMAVKVAAKKMAEKRAMMNNS